MVRETGNEGRGAADERPPSRRSKREGLGRVDGVVRDDALCSRQLLAH
ncbi:hypothetical protein GZL_09357 [Streptomyces sp. 769]|nr:hypothetical protein GZL_00056 [Streptomyces sp. 769]AJC61875.1 hypothetical protein GZL_09357 [Streptomyces sp. 769]